MFELDWFSEESPLTEPSLLDARSFDFFSCEKAEEVMTRKKNRTDKTPRNLFHTTLTIAVPPMAELLLGSHKLIRLVANATFDQKLELETHHHL